MTGINTMGSDQIALQIAKRLHRVEQLGARA